MQDFSKLFHIMLSFAAGALVLLISELFVLWVMWLEIVRFTTTLDVVLFLIPLLLAIALFALWVRRRRHPHWKQMLIAGMAAYLIGFMVAWLSKWTGNLVTTAIVMFAVSTPTAAYVYRLGLRTESHRDRIACLIMLYTTVVMIFAALYALCFSIDNQQFSFGEATPDTIAARAHSDYQSKKRRFDNLAINRQLEGLFRWNRNAFLRAMKDPGKWHSIDGDSGMVRWVESVNAEDGLFFPFELQVTAANGDRFRLSFNAKNENDDPSAWGGWPAFADILEAHGHGLEEWTERNPIDDKTLESIMISIIRTHYPDPDSMYEVAPTPIPPDDPWRISSFVYFSAVTMTTLGYGDIAPAGWMSRWLVIIQSMFSVAYLAYAVQILPRRMLAEESERTSSGVAGTK